MLASLRIQNLALVEDLSLEWGRGFTVLTGETGAGKSLLVDALSLLVGAKGDADLVRQGSERAVVEAVVEGSWLAWNAFLQERGLPEEQPVVLRREVSAGGRSRVWINGGAGTVADLREAGRIWMRLTSQHDHQSLLAEDRHLGLLDEALGIRADLSPEASAVREAESKLKARRRSEAEREHRLETLAEALADLEKLAPKPGEWAQLRLEREPLRNAAQLEHAFREAAEALDEALPEVDAAHRAFARAAAILPESQLDHDRLRSTLLELEDLFAVAKDQALRWSKEGVERIEALEARLAAYEKLARRHRVEPEELSKRWEELKAEQKLLLGGGQDAQELERELAKAAEAYRRAALKLHERREKMVPKLESEVHRRLARLGMKGARLQCRIGLAEEGASPVLHEGHPVKVAATGFTSLALWIESNPGEGFRPLGKVASGGELSRVMLSFLGAGIALGPRSDGKPDGAGEDGEESLTLVLDEVDAGLGGETALAVGEAVQDLGRRHQVLAVTHLAQVAARADHHGHLRKHTAAGRTTSRHAWLDGDGRVRELARLLSGHPDRPEALTHARSLFEGSQVQPGA